jgi:hypothetical protein
MNDDLEVEGEKAAPYPIYRLGVDQHGREAPVERVNECWTELEVLDFEPRLDSRYVVYVSVSRSPCMTSRPGRGSSEWPEKRENTRSGIARS